MENFELLTEKEEMWAKMLTEVLSDNNIQFSVIPVYGAGMALKAGIKERLKIYVPSEQKEKAELLMAELFSEGKTD